MDQQYKRTLQGLLKLSVNSPSSFVHFAAGSLPGSALLDLRQLALFGMICRLPDNPLNTHAKTILLNPLSSPMSWFTKLRNLLLKYQLPHPLILLESPLKKEPYKKLVKSKVIDYWENKLRGEASFLRESGFMPYFSPEYLSLLKPHRIITSAGSRSYEVSKARIQLQFLSSQYRCAKLTRHWSSTNPNGFCTYPSCSEIHVVESLEHILLTCPAYTKTRQGLINAVLKLRSPHSHTLALSVLLSGNHPITMQLLLDCSVIPEVIRSAQIHGDQIYDDICYIGRTWCFALHRERMKRLHLWNFS